MTDAIQTFFNTQQFVQIVCSIYYCYSLYHHHCVYCQSVKMSTYTMPFWRSSQTPAISKHASTMSQGPTLTLFRISHYLSSVLSVKDIVNMRW